MEISLLMWAIFSPIAAAMAYLVTFEEYRRHFPDQCRAVRESLRTAFVTLAIFLILGCIVAVLMPRITQ